MMLCLTPKHENGLAWIYHGVSLRGMKVVTLWSGKPAPQSGLDIAPNPELSPRWAESTQGRLFRLSMSFHAAKRRSKMETIITCCAGLNVNKESVEACVRRMEPNGKLHQQTRH